MNNLRREGNKNKNFCNKVRENPRSPCDISTSVQFRVTDWAGSSSKEVKG